MSDKNISLKDECNMNDLEAYNLSGAVCISVFEFECELSRESTEKLRDFLNDLLSDWVGIRQALEDMDNE